MTTMSGSALIIKIGPLLAIENGAELCLFEVRVFVTRATRKPFPK